MKKINLKINLLFVALSLPLIGIFSPKPAQAQFLPQPWVTVGSQDSETTYGVGVRFMDFGAEVGRGPKGATGGDILKFFSVPLVPVSPYVGVGVYGNDKGVSYSGGVHITPPGNTFFGVGYNSVRGINGQLGIKF